MADNEIRDAKFLITIPEMELFFKKVNKTQKCWEWNGYRDINGYGRITIRNTPILVHVLSYVLHNGKIPNNLHVLHSCDVPYCVNPSHLWVGTHQENMADRNQKGRCGSSGRSGEQINTCKLNTLIVKEIRESVANGAKQIQMAKRFGVSNSTINSLIKEKTWKQI